MKTVYPPQTKFAGGIMMQNLSFAAVLIGALRVKFSLSVHIKNLVIWVGLFDSILNIPVNQSTIFHLCQDGSSWVEPVLSKVYCVSLKDIMQCR